MNFNFNKKMLARWNPNLSPICNCGVTIKILNFLFKNVCKENFKARFKIVMS